MILLLGFFRILYKLFVVLVELKEVYEKLFYIILIFESLVFLFSFGIWKINLVFLRKSWELGGRAGV